MTGSHALFEKVYVEKRAAADEVTCRVFERLGNPEPEYIEHYKDVFDVRSKAGQPDSHKADEAESSGGSRRQKSLILAHNSGRRIYEGAPVCQSFGNEHFYYTATVMNCLYDCEYCFLKGMYPSRDICIFTDIDETFRELDEIEKDHPAYVCASYNTDLVALEDLTGYATRWCERVCSDDKLQVEIRTKCSRTDIYESLPVSERMIFAFTLSPDEIIRDYEKGASNLDGRLRAVRAAMKAGFRVRLCLDPMLYVRGWRDMYSEMIRKAAEEIKDLSSGGSGIKDISIGTFRISDQYLKRMRKIYSDSQIIQYPYICENGYYQYSEKVASQMEEHILALLNESFRDVPIFNWRRG